jgi:small-conductance mechanosensitive channel
VEKLFNWLDNAQIGFGSHTISLGRLSALVVLVAGAWWVASIAEHGIRRIAERRSTHPGDYSGAYAIGRVIRYTLLATGVLWGLSVAGVDITSLAIFGGAIGVGIGLGLQSLVANFISGIILMVERSLKIGDFVDLQSGVRGRVVEIAMRYTRVTTNDHVDILVPNSEFVNGRVTNWTLEEYSRRFRVPFGVAYGSDKEKVREAALAAAGRVSGVIEDDRRRSELWMTGFGDSSLNFELLIWVGPKAIRSPGRTHSAALWALDDELRARGIEIPFPQRDLHFRSGRIPVDLTQPKPGGGAVG